MWHTLSAPKKGVLAFISEERLFCKFLLRISKEGFFVKMLKNQEKSLKIQYPYTYKLNISKNTTPFSMKFTPLDQEFNPLFFF